MIPQSQLISSLFHQLAFRHLQPSLSNFDNFPRSPLFYPVIPDNDAQKFVISLPSEICVPLLFEFLPALYGVLQSFLLSLSTTSFQSIESRTQCGPGQFLATKRKCLNDRTLRELISLVKMI